MAREGDHYCRGHKDGARDCYRVARRVYMRGRPWVWHAGKRVPGRSGYIPIGWMCSKGHFTAQSAAQIEALATP